VEAISLSPTVPTQSNPAGETIELGLIARSAIPGDRTGDWVRFGGFDRRSDIRFSNIGGQSPGWRRRLTGRGRFA